MEALREEVARLRGERGRVKGLKAQLERSVAHLQEQRTSFLKQQARHRTPLSCRAAGGKAAVVCTVKKSVSCTIVCSGLMRT